MIVGCDQKLGIVLTNDNTGTASLYFSLLRRVSTVLTKHSVVVLNLFYRFGCNGNDTWHCLFYNIRYIKATLCCTLIFAVILGIIRFLLGFQQLNLIFACCLYALLIACQIVNSCICSCCKAACQYCTKTNACCLFKFSL